MKKVLIALTLVLCLLITGCSKAQETSKPEDTTQKDSEKQEKEDKEKTVFSEISLTLTVTVSLTLLSKPSNMMPSSRCLKKKTRAVTLPFSVEHIGVDIYKRWLILAGL